MASEENAVQSACLSYLKIKGVFCWRNNNTPIFDSRTKRYRSMAGIRGVADILGIYKGRFLAVECKSKNGRLSKHQKAFREEITDKGGIYIVARSVQDLYEGLEAESD